MNELCKTQFQVDIITTTPPRHNHQVEELNTQYVCTKNEEIQPPPFLFLYWIRIPN